MTTLAMIRRAMRRALQWRLLLLSPVVLLVAATATLFPLLRFLGDLLDHSTRWQELTAGLDSPALAGLAKALMTPAAAGLATGVRTSVVLALVFAPLLAGAALVVAEADGRPRFRALLSGAAGYYGRLFRMQLAALVPLGIAGVIMAVALNWASRVSDHATSEAATHTSGRLALLVSVLVVFLGQLVIDAGRARLAAEPHRRSALIALGAGVKLVVKRPRQVLALGASSAVVALVAAAALLVVRQQFAQSSAAAILLAFVLAQLAVAAIAWGHAAKLCGLVEIARRLAADGGTEPAAPETDAPEPSPASTDDVPEPVLPAMPVLPPEPTPAAAPPPPEPTSTSAPPEG